MWLFGNVTMGLSGCVTVRLCGYSALRGSPLVGGRLINVPVPCAKLCHQSEVVSAATLTVSAETERMCGLGFREKIACHDGLHRSAMILPTALVTCLVTLQSVSMPPSSLNASFCSCCSKPSSKVSVSPVLGVASKPTHLGNF